MLYGFVDLVTVKRLDEKTVCAGLQRLLNMADRSQCTDDNHLCISAMLTDLLRRLMAVELGHVDVDECDIRLMLDAEFERLLAIARFTGNMVITFTQQHAQNITRHSIVVGDDEIEFGWCIDQWIFLLLNRGDARQCLPCELPGSVWIAASSIACNFFSMRAYSSSIAFKRAGASSSS